MADAFKMSGVAIAVTKRRSLGELNVSIGAPASPGWFERAERKNQRELAIKLDQIDCLHSVCLVSIGKRLPIHVEVC